MARFASDSSNDWWPKNALCSLAMNDRRSLHASSLHSISIVNMNAWICRIYMFYSIIHRIGKSLFLLHPSWSHGFYMDERTKRTACRHIANIPQQHHQIKSFWPMSSLKLNTHFLLLSFFLSKFDRWPLSTQKCFCFCPACERKRARIDACLVPMTRSISEYSYTFHLAVQRIYRWKISRIMANQYNTITLAGCRSVVATG